MKRKHKKHHSYRRRKGMGAIPGGLAGTVTNVAAIAVGALAAKYVKGKLLSSQSPMIQTAAPVALGLALTALVKNPMVKSVGAGMLVGPVVDFSSSKLGLGAFTDADTTSIMENITIGAPEVTVGATPEITVGEDITIGAYDEMYND